MNKKYTMYAIKQEAKSRYSPQTKRKLQCAYRLLRPMSQLQNSNFTWIQNLNMEFRMKFEPKSGFILTPF